MLFVKPSVTDINWCGDLNRPGMVVEGAECVSQRIMVVLSTTKGSDMLRPTFGVGIPTYLDKSTTAIAGKIKSEIVSAIKQWVPEVSLTNVKYSYTNAGLIYNITGTYKGNAITPITFALAGNGILISVARAPVSGSYKVVVYLNGQEPIASDVGYDNVRDLYGWAIRNFDMYGTWGYLDDLLVLYGNPAYKIMKIEII